MKEKTWREATILNQLVIIYSKIPYVKFLGVHEIADSYLRLTKEIPRPFISFNKLS